MVIVERIKQEMGIQLVLQILQFCFRTLLLHLPPYGFHFKPTVGHTDGNTQGSDQQVEHRIPTEEAYDFPCMI